MSRARDTANQINRVNSSAADATALTVDSSENVLIGQTTASSGTVGTSLRPDGRNFYCADGNYSAHFNRNTSDGAIVHFAKDDTIVGSIATYGGDLIVGTGDTRLRFVDSLDSLLPVSNSTGASRDAGIDLGHSETRYKDIYTSGGIYLGATSNSTPVTANYLSDYEEGTWTPTATNGGSFSNSAYGTYTKIGNVVTLHATLIVSSNSSGLGFGITSLPFAQSSSNTEAAAGFYMRYTSDSTLRMVYLSNGNVISVYNIGGGATTFGTASTKRYDFSGVYYTDA
jgi:hypothetical protein